MPIRPLATALLAGAFLAAVWTLPLRGQEYDAPGYSTPQQAAALDPGDPPSRVARLSLLNGDASLEPATVDQFSPAELNYPLTSGDRLYTGAGSQAEIEAGQMAVRLTGNTDFTVTALTDTLAQFGLGGGSVHLRTFALEPGTDTELDTPNAAISVLQPGDVRVDVEPNRSITIVTLLSGVVQVDADGVSQQLAAGQSLRLRGTASTEADWVRRSGADALDQFSNSRDALYLSETQGESGYLDAATIGGGDLEQYGSWSENVDGDEGGTLYNTVWFPSVAVSWVPYRDGRWSYIAPWGWTWVGAEPWGFAPFHYGRWVTIRGRWGWLPGPRILRPVYSPALVGFVGTPGVGVTAWFPLGPREAYRPPYRASSLYVNRVNVSNIYSRDPAEARRIYNDRSHDLYAGTAPARYRNRSLALTAMAREHFAAGRPVREDRQAIDSRAVAAAPVLNRPIATPEGGAFASGNARVMPQRTGRPLLAARGPAEAESQRNSGSPSTAHNAPSQGGTDRGVQPGGFQVSRRGQGQPSDSAQGTATVPVRSGAVENSNDGTGTMHTGPLRQPVDSGLRANGTVQRPGLYREQNGSAQPGRPTETNSVQPTAQPSFPNQRQPLREGEALRPQPPRMQEMPREVRRPEVQQPRPAPAPQMQSRPAPAPPARPAASAAPQQNDRK